MSMEEKVENQYKMLLEKFRNYYKNYLKWRKLNRKRKMRFFRRKCSKYRHQILILGLLKDGNSSFAGQELKRIVEELRGSEMASLG